MEWARALPSPLLSLEKDAALTTVVLDEGRRAVGSRSVDHVERRLYGMGRVSYRVRKNASNDALGKTALSRRRIWRELVQ